MKKFALTSVFASILFASSFAMAQAQRPAPSTDIQYPAQASGPAAPAAKMTAQEALAKLKEKLAINGSAQESAWANFVQSNSVKMDQQDISLVQEIRKAKTTPELFAATDALQQRSRERYESQKQALLALYATLEGQQKTTLDSFIFGTMGNMLNRMGKH